MRLWLGVLAVTAPSVARAQLGLVPLDIRVPKAPTPVASDGLTHFIYELRVTNLGRTDYTINEIAVSGASAGAELGRWSGDSLKRISMRMGEQGAAALSSVVGSGRQVLVYLDVPVRGGPIPSALEHRFLVVHADSLRGTVTDTLRDYLVPVSGASPTVLASPLKGGPWLAANGPGNTSGHRRTVIPLGGQGRIAQRFATDWIKVGVDGRLWQGDSLKNESWYGYNEPVSAVAAGAVVATKDGIPQNVPFNREMAVPITLETVGGNHVILDLGGGVYAFYAHLIPGSLQVKVGDKVKRGQLIGRLGNSGNSTAPHLHFHMGDRNSPLGTEGLPFVIDEYVKLGEDSRAGFDRWTATEPEVTRKRELPFENQVVRFKP